MGLIETRQLYVVNPSGQGGGFGGQAEPYRLPEVHAGMMDSVQSELFLDVVAKVRAGLSGPHHRQVGDQIFVNIDLPHHAYGVHLTCTLEWRG